MEGLYSTLNLLVRFMLSLSSEELQRLNNLRDVNIFEGDVLAVSAVSAGTYLVVLQVLNFFVLIVSTYVVQVRSSKRSGELS